MAIKIGGCFPGTSDVITSGGVTKAMRDVRLGERVLGVDVAEGRLVYTEVIAFLDRDGEQQGYFYTLTTDLGHAVTLTAKHLIYVTDSNATAADSRRGGEVWGAETTTGEKKKKKKKNRDGGLGGGRGGGGGGEGDFAARFQTVFAEEVRVGDVIMVLSDDRPQDALTGMRPARVTHVRAGVQAGVYAPLTATGTIVVDGALASCYAVINNPALAHAVFAPMRGWHELSARLPWLSPLFSLNTEVDSLPQKGKHLYAKLLYELGSLILSRDVLYVP